MSSDADSCKHQPVYYGVININIDERTIGSIDVWRCPACTTRFCEEKRLGIESITDTIGMPKIAQNEKWGVVVCKLQKGQDKWKLVRMPESGAVQHECLEEKVIRLDVESYKADDGQHWSFLVDDHVNQAVEISGRGIEH